MIPPTKKVATMVFEELMVTHQKLPNSFTWQMTLRLELSEPPCVQYLASKGWPNTTSEISEVRYINQNGWLIIITE